VAVDCIANTSDKCTASVFILKVSMERELSEQIEFLEPTGGGKSLLAFYVKAINVMCEEFEILRPRPTANRILGQLNSRIKLCNIEVASLMEQQIKKYVVVILKKTYLGINTVGN
jgi:predicted restriction endonuclease